MKSDGTDLHALAGGCTGTNRCAFDTAPAYSPDGRRISFERVYGPFVHRFDPGLMTTLDFASRVDLMVVDANGGMPAVLWSWGLDLQPWDGTPRWSPDGAHIVLPFGTFKHPNKHTLLGAALFVLDVKRGAQRRITPWALGAGNPDWSPDGRRIAFNSEGGHSPSIYVVDADGGRLTRVLAGATRRGIIGQTQSPVWSPDGRQLAFASEPDPCRSLHVGACGNAVFTLNLYVMNADGSRVRRLTSAHRFESHPVWGKAR